MLLAASRMVTLGALLVGWVAGFVACAITIAWREVERERRMGQRRRRRS
jgi:uncharacterized protein (DUF2062 family)